MNTIQLLNGKELCAAMKVSDSFLLAMKRAGYEFAYGHQSTLESALEWRRSFPGFRSYSYLRKDWESLPKLRLIDKRPTVEGDGKSH